VDPSGLPAESVKAPWIFVGIQQMLRYLPAVVAGVALPLAAALIVAVLPFASARRTALNTTVFLVLVVFTLLLTVWGYLV
jgi:quinol-cytochrome oxidoreductase complex cytochrome b subunit